MTEEDRDAPKHRELERDIPPAAGYVRAIAAALDDEVIRRLEAVGVPILAQAIAFSRAHLIGAGAAACSRVPRLFDDATLDAPDLLQALMQGLATPTPEAEALLRRRSEPADAAVATPAAVILIYNERRSSSCDRNPMPSLWPSCPPSNVLSLHVAMVRKEYRRGQKPAEWDMPGIDSMVFWIIVSLNALTRLTSLKLHMITFRATA